MKNSIILIGGLILSLSLLFTSCSREVESDLLLEAQNEELKYFDVPVIEGTLHFKNVDHFIQKSEELNLLAEENRIQEANKFFTSLELLNNNVKTELSQLEEGDTYNSILQSNADIITENLDYVINKPSLAPVLNRQGIVVIGANIYKYGKEEDRVYTNAVDKLKDELFENERPFTIKHQEETALRGNCHPTYNTASKAKCSRKVTITVKDVSLAFYDNSKGLWDVYGKIRFEGTPYKRRNNCKGSWKTYRTSNYLNISTCWWWTVNGQENNKETFYNTNNWWGINWTPTLNIKRGVPFNEITDWFLEIYRLDANYWSGGVSSPGAEIDCW